MTQVCYHDVKEKNLSLTTSITNKLSSITLILPYSIF